jgi:hypothetical protein
MAAKQNPEENQRMFPALVRRSQNASAARANPHSRSILRSRWLPTFDQHSLAQPFHVPVQVRVVVAIHPHSVELVDRVAARFVEEGPADVPDTTALMGVPFCSMKSTASCLCLA